MRITTLQLFRISTPVVGDWMTLKDSSEENADPPAEYKGRRHINGHLEAGGRKEANVKGENGGFDDWHGAGVQDLQRKHDFALGCQFFCKREAGIGSCGLIDFLFAYARYCNTYDIVHGYGEGQDLGIRLSYHESGSDERAGNTKAKTTR